MLPNQNTWRIFGSVIVFLEVRGEFIPVENERLLSAPLVEKRPGGETGRETGWIFLFF